MKVGVVIPCYNHAHYVGKALESILGQTRAVDRIVVIDDGSQDNSPEVLREFESRGVEVHLQENAGAHNTINRAVALASETCEVVSILNSDDFYGVERMEKCLPVFESGHQGIVVTDLNYIDDDGNPLPEDAARAKWFRAVWSPKTADPDYAEWMGMANFPVTTSNVIAHRDFLARYPFRPYRFNHDYFFLSAAVLEGLFQLVPEKLVHYRVHATNTINTAPAPLLREMLRMHLDLYHDFAPRLEADAALRQRFARYTCAAWDNVSSFHAGLFQVLLAKLAEQTDSGDLESLVSGLTDTAYPELADFPNKALVNAHNPESGIALGPESGLGEKFAALKAERDSLKADNRALRELASLRQELLNSRGSALKRLIGALKPADQGKSPAEKLANLRKQLEK